MKEGKDELPVGREEFFRIHSGTRGYCTIKFKTLSLSKSADEQALTNACFALCIDGSQNSCSRRSVEVQLNSWSPLAKTGGAFLSTSVCCCCAVDVVHRENIPCYADLDLDLLDRGYWRDD
jgi:hypothetical protein